MISILSEADKDADITAVGDVVCSYGSFDLVVGSSRVMLLAKMVGRST